MVDPFSLAGVGAVALAEGIKFLYQQAGEVLVSWRKHREGATPESGQATLRLPAEIIEGTLAPVEPDLQRVARVEGELRAMRAQLADYADGIEWADPADERLREQADALRRLLEAVYGQRITFKGEQRDPSGPLVEGDIDVDRVAGDVAAVRARTIKAGKVKGRAKAERVDEGGTLRGVDADHIG